ncbi:hypothetical protein BDR07DRAFT_1485437 [Suillus spraguei]|nr:hypothetical protein BDR07DRAFT_1485437 [Suillus spraguei]
MSLDDLDNGTHSQCARCGSKHGALKSSKIGFYDEKDKQNVYYTRKLVMLDMLLETSWEDNCSTLEAVAIECLSSACARTGHGFWFRQNLPFLNDPAVRTRILKPSWFMYGLLGTALYCAIRRTATDRLAKTKNVLQFSTQEFQPVAIGIQNTIKQYLDHPELDNGEFLPHMTAHHEQCLKALRAHTGEASPMKKYNIYVPSSSSELYWLRTSTTSGTSTSALTSNSIPLLVPQNALASS